MFVFCCCFIVRAGGAGVLWGGPVAPPTSLRFGRMSMLVTLNGQLPFWLKHRHRVPDFALPGTGGPFPPCKKGGLSWDLPQGMLKHPKLSSKNI